MGETRKAFHESLHELTSDVIRLAALVVESVQLATAALLDADLAKVEQVIADDRPIDALTHSIEQSSYLLLARQAPMAVDLRTLVAVLRVIHELERTGDLMVNVAKASRRLYPHSIGPKLRGLIDRMREQATVQLRLAVDAFAELDPVKAAALEDMDDVMDDLQKDLFRTVLGATTIDEVAIQRAVQIALVGRFYERTADHAVNIGERVKFMVTGDFPTAAGVRSASADARPH